jgi:hypothetical protein
MQALGIPCRFRLASAGSSAALPAVRCPYMFAPACMEPAAFPVDVGLVMHGDGVLEAGQAGPSSYWLRQVALRLQPLAPNFAQWFQPLHGWVRTQAGIKESRHARGREGGV